MPFFDTIEERRKILLDNIYGVDLNEESVEITKLSLFLKVCKNGLKLPNLDNNIKCGNSLINDSEYTDKPFNWKNEFSEIFKNGGFDIVIGNPPWGAKLDKKSKEFINNSYKALEYQIDTYVVFMEKTYNLLKDNGYLGFVIPSTWLSMHYFKKIRQFLINNSSFESVILFKYMVFDDVTAESCILTYKKRKLEEDNQIKISYLNKPSEFKDMIFQTVNQEFWQKNYLIGFNVQFNQEKLSLIEKLYNNSLLLDKIADITIGIKPYQTNKGKPKQTKEDVKNRIYDSREKINSNYKPFIVGRNITRYAINPPLNQWLKYGIWLAEPRNTLDFEKTRIVLRQTSDHIIASIDETKYINLNNVHNIVVNDDFELKYLLTILNSKLIDFIYKYLVPEVGRVFAEVKTVNLAKIPIKKIDYEQQKPFIIEANKILQLNKDLLNEINGFKEWLQREPYNIDSFSKKLNKYYKLSFNDFLVELKKKNVDIRRKDTRNLLKKYLKNVQLKLYH